MTPRIYLAGYDVFRADAVEYGNRLKTLCLQRGLQGLFPMDQQAPVGLSGEALARWIFRANVALIESADAVMANLNNFRGAEPDSGTAWEVGYAAALGKPVWGYLGDGRPLREQVGVDALGRDRDGFTVENFGLPRNLMLACSARLVIGSATDCLERIASALQVRVSLPAARSPAFG